MRAAALALLLLAACTPQEPQSRLDPGLISKALGGIQGEFDRDANVFSLRVPRNGLHVSIRGAVIPPAFGLECQASFTGTGTPEEALVIAEVPLLENEVNPFLDAALDVGFVPTALHNSLLWEEPRVFSLHLQTKGPQGPMAEALGSLLSRLKAGQLVQRLPALATVAPGKFDPEIVHRNLWKGEMIDGAYRVSTGRGTRVGEQPVGRAMGVESWASFTGTNEHALVDGDIALLESELSKVLKAMVQGHLQIVSIHTHLAQETPKVMFVHFLGAGPLEELATSVRVALKQEKNFRGSQ